jgi:peptide/nickel transport system substrate-binding protein
VARSRELLKYGADLKPMPVWRNREISPDGLTYTFKLLLRASPSTTCKPTTSEDVVFSCMKVLTETHPRARQNFARRVRRGARSADRRVR